MAERSETIDEARQRGPLAVEQHFLVQDHQHGERGD
jgi:hypothetical protein